MDTRGRRRLIVIAVLLGFIPGAGMTWAALTRPFPFGGDGGGGVADGPQQSFTITGDLAEPVSPGVAVPLELRISNPLDSALAISLLRVEITAVDAPNATASRPCGVDDFSIEQLTGYRELTVGAGATSTIADLGVPREDWPRVQMVASTSNQDGCKGAAFSLGYSAVGRIVG